MTDSNALDEFDRRMELVRELGAAQAIITGLLGRDTDLPRAKDWHPVAERWLERHERMFPTLPRAAERGS